MMRELDVLPIFLEKEPFRIRQNPRADILKVRIADFKVFKREVT